MRLIKYFVPLFAALFLLLPGRTAQAGTSFGIAFTLNSPVVAVSGLETNLTGLIENTGVTDVFLNDVQIAFDGDAAAYLTGDPNVFIDNVPGLFVVGDPVYNGPVIGVLVSSLTPPGLYTGSVTLLGGADENARIALATATFQIQTVNAPEPSAAALLLTGLALCGRRSRRQNA